MKSRITKRFAVTAVLCVLIMALAAPALAASYRKVYGQTQQRVRVRESASSSATIIDNIVKGACVYITDSVERGEATYVKVNYRNSNGDIDSGWVCQNDGDETLVKVLSADQAYKTFSVKEKSLPSKKVGTFTKAEREEAEKAAPQSGSKQEIERAQTILKALKYYTGEITGNVGTKTEAAIKQFQGEYDLTKDGVLGPKTMAKLEAVYADKGGSSASGSGSSSGSALRRGSSGSDVRDLQMDLTSLGYYWADITGSYGAKTEAAVKNFQEKNKLTADGVAGSKTLKAIADAIGRNGGSSSTNSYASGTTLREGSQGTAVSNLQTDLKQLGYYTASITGNFGTKTEAAVKDFQSDKGLAADGVAGSKTLAAIVKAIKDVGGSVTNSSNGMKLGSTGDKVRALQADLTALGYYYGDLTGHYGSMTQTAVKKFQKAKGLTQDGVAGTTTLNAIASALGGSSSSGGSVSGSALREGDKSDAVLEMQEMLKELGYYYGNLTGSFGSLTKKAVRAFQDDQDLTVDGIAGTKTLNKLYSLTGKTNTGNITSTGAAVSEKDSYGEITRDDVNLRSSYSLSSATKIEMDEGTQLRITRVHNVGGTKWYYVTVKVGGTTYKGYVIGTRVKLIDKDDYKGDNLDLGDKEILGMIKVNTNNVNLRDEPDGDRVGRANKGDVFYYIDSEDGWFQTKSGYWIKRDYADVLSADEIDDYVNSGTYDGETYRLNDTGDMVRWLQEALDKLGYYDGEKSGHYGRLTAEAVRQYQRAHDLSADGVAGPKTIAAITESLSNNGSGSTGGSAIGGKYNATIYNYDWFDHKSTIVAKGSKTPTITDILTGRTLKIKIQSTGNHADVEPLKAEDTEVLCSLYGVATASQLKSQNKYQRRAVVFTNGAGEQFVGSIYAIPHGLNTVSGNNFDGQFCLHFLGSTIHSGDGGSVNPSENHQAMIEAAAKTLDEQKDADGNKLYNVITKK